MAESSKEAMDFLNLETLPAAGVVISGIVTDGPAQKAGLKVKDIIVAVDGTPVSSGRELHDQVSFKKPGQNITVSVLRDNKPRTIKVVTEAKPEIAALAVTMPTPELTEADYGFAVKTLTRELAAKFELTVTNGVIVTGVGAFSPAANQGINIDLNEGDVITKLNNKPVTNAEDFTARLKAVAPGKQWTVEVIQKGAPEAHFKVYHAPDSP
jgi:serine protease Do